MLVRFMFTEEIDIVPPPKGWRWAGSAMAGNRHVSLLPIVVTAEPTALGGVSVYPEYVSAGVSVYPEYVSAGFTAADGIYHELGKFDDTRTASIALIKAMGLEVAP